MDRVTINIETDGGTRASETIADLRNAAETLYFPMTLVGFWDYQADMHLCPQEERQQTCPHNLPENDPQRVEYESTLQRERRASVAIMFPHARVTIYLS